MTYIPSETVQMLKKIGVMFYQQGFIGCDILTALLAEVRYYTSLNTQSVMFQQWKIDECDIKQSKHWCDI